MARGVALSQLVTNLRLETGRSSTAIANADEKAQLEYLLRSKQAFYYDDYEWPHLNVYRRLVPVANQRFYTFPTDMNFEAVKGLFVKDGGSYTSLLRGIDFGHYNSHDSLQARAATGTVTVTAGTSSPGTNKVTAINVNSIDVLGASIDWTTSDANTATLLAAQINTFASTPEYTAAASGAVVTITAKITAGTTPNTFVVAATVAGDVTTTDVAMAGGVVAEQSDPPRRWELLEDDETDADAIEVWPVPASSDAELWLVGKRALGDLLVDADTALLDDQLLVLTVAAELLAKAKKQDAQAKAIAAGRRYNQMKARSKAAAQPFKLRGGTDQTAERAGIMVRVSG